MSDKNILIGVGCVISAGLLIGVTISDNVRYNKQCKESAINNQQRISQAVDHTYNVAYREGYASGYKESIIALHYGYNEYTIVPDKNGNPNADVYTLWKKSEILPNLHQGVESSDKVVKKK